MTCNRNHSFFRSNTAIHVTSRYIQPVLQFGPGSIQGRAGPEDLENCRSPARSIQAPRINQVGLTMIYSRAGKKPVCFIPGPVYTGPG